MRHTHVVVSGTVQAVGYRDAARQTAVELGVAGWVRNRADGTVEAELHGEEEHVQQMIDWMRSGPRFAHVDRTVVTETDATGPLDFTVRDDA
ncbi:acylphosphatase [Microbacterium sp. NPDC089189]|uniref:acylphosphatase n=1 Tax=Microbacterium sp. NPDC089189 TaxID=3154972 RepID=UPI003429922C